MIFIYLLIISHKKFINVSYDPNDRACGIDEAVKDYPLIYLAVPYIGYLNRTTCVKECPTWGFNNVSKPKSLKCVVNKVLLDCDEH